MKPCVLENAFVSENICESVNESDGVNVAEASNGSVDACVADAVKLPEGVNISVPVNDPVLVKLCDNDHACVSMNAIEMENTFESLNADDSAK